jgi:hypothetical protein
LQYSANGQLQVTRDDRKDFFPLITKRSQDIWRKGTGFEVVYILFVAWKVLTALGME